MSRVKVFQNTFNSGQVDPTSHGRFDNPSYTSAAADITNGFCMPAGGVRKREGFRRVKRLNWSPDVPKYANVDIRSRLEKFEFGNGESYVFAFSSANENEDEDVSTVAVYNDETLELEATLAMPFTPYQLYQFDQVQSGDTMILVHPKHIPRMIQRLADGVWSVVPIPFVNIPKFQFTNADVEYTVDDAATAFPTAFDEQIINFDNINVGNTFRLSLQNQIGSSMPYAEGATKSDIESSLQSILGNSNFTVTVKNQKVRVGEEYSESNPEPEFYFIDVFDYIKVVFTGSNVGKIGPMNTDHAGIVITAVGDSNYNSGGSQNPNEVLPEEPVWSSDRGWPATVTFHENRLWFGGSKSRPSTLWGSRIGHYFDFSIESDTDIVDDDYIDFTLDTDQVNAITSLYSDVHLLIFTNGAEFYVDAKPITPETFTAKPSGRVGSIRASAVHYDNSVMFITKGNSTVSNFSYDLNKNRYITSSITKLATSIISKPKQLVVQNANKSDEGNYLYLVNDDGTIAVFSGDSDNTISAWSTIKSDQCRYQSICVTSNDNVWISSERYSNGRWRIFLEVQEPGLYLDGAMTVTCDSNGYAHELQSLRDCQIQVVDDKGEKILDGEMSDWDASFYVGEAYADKVVTLGMPYEFKIKTLPLAIEGHQGNTRYDRKRILKAIVEVLDAKALEILYNNKRRLFKNRSFPTKLGESIPLFSGFYEMLLNGYSRSTVVELIQNEPYSLTVLLLGLEVEI